MKDRMSRELLRTHDKGRLFELYLLSFMRASSVAVSSALAQLNSTEAELAAVRTSMKGLAFQMIGGPNVDFFYDMLGEPLSRKPINDPDLSAPFDNYHELHYALSVWPEFDFVVKELPDGGTFGVCFRRTNAALAPPLNAFSDLEPWKFVREEVDARFGLPKIGDAWDTWEELEYMIPESPNGLQKRYSLLFDFNLLQSAKQVTTGGTPT